MLIIVSVKTLKKKGRAHPYSGSFVLKVHDPTGSEITEIPCVPDLKAN